MAYHIRKHGIGRIKGAGGKLADPAIGSGNAPGAGVKQKYPLERGLPVMKAPASGVTSGYAKNAYAGPSSAPVGDAIESDMASMLREAGDDGEAVLKGLIAHGHTDNSGTNDPAADLYRKISTDQNVPNKPGMKNPNANPTTISGGVPFKL